MIGSMCKLFVWIVWVWMPTKMLMHPRKREMDQMTNTARWILFPSNNCTIISIWIQTIAVFTAHLCCCCGCVPICPPTAAMLMITLFVQHHQTNNTCAAHWTASKHKLSTIGLQTSRIANIYSLPNTKHTLTGGSGWPIIPSMVPVGKMFQRKTLGMSI